MSRKVAAPKRRSRNGTIDLIKFVFTIHIMLYHANKVCPGGYIAVDFFFLISGFLMAKSMLRTQGTRVTETLLGRETLRFTLHKAAGLFPMYFTAWVGSFVITCFAQALAVDEWLSLLQRSLHHLFLLQMSGEYYVGHGVIASWYISALLIAIFILYPIRRKWPHIFDYVIGPGLGLLFMGMVSQAGGRTGALTVTYDEFFHMYDGVVRAIAGVALGCSCYRLCCKLAELRLRIAGRILVSLAEYAGYTWLFFLVWTPKELRMDLVMIPLFAGCMILSFSEQGILAVLFRCPVFSWLGEFSYAMYLTHEMIRTVVLPIWCAEWTTDPAMYLVAFIGFTLAAALPCYGIGKLLQFTCRKLGPLLRRALVKEKSLFD